MCGEFPRASDFGFLVSLGIGHWNLGLLWRLAPGVWSFDSGFFRHWIFVIRPRQAGVTA
jgi:hypothetical protein